MKDVIEMKRSLKTVQTIMEDKIETKTTMEDEIEKKLSIKTAITTMEDDIEKKLSIETAQTTMEDDIEKKLSIETAQTTMEDEIETKTTMEDEIEKEVSIKTAQTTMKVEDEIEKKTTMEDETEKELSIKTAQTTMKVEDDIEKKLPIKTAGKPIRCKAAVARKAGEALKIEEIIVAPPNAYEVRIRIICTTLCYSDVNFWKKKDPPGYFPRIFGHEAIGVVESVGENVHEVTEGDTVIPAFMADCRECADCKSEKSNQCTTLPFKLSPWMHRDDTSRFTDLNGEALYHFLFVSSFSEYTVVDIAHLAKIDPAAPPDRACLLGCAVSTGVGAAIRTAKVEPGSSVAIFGLGAVGLSVAEGARLCGAAKIIGIDIYDSKEEMGKKFGVTDFVNSRNCGNKTVSQVINELTDGGADYCFECVGLSSLVEEAFACCRKGWGKTIMVGASGTNLSLNSYDVLHDGKSLMGSLFGGLKAKSDIPILLKRYMDKELRLDEFVTHEVEFKDINKAFDLFVQGKTLRCVIWMNK